MNWALTALKGAAANFICHSYVFHYVLFFAYVNRHIKKIPFYWCAEHLRLFGASNMLRILLACESSYFTEPEVF